MFTKSFALLVSREKPCRSETSTRRLIRLLITVIFFTKIRGHGHLKIIHFNFLKL